MRAISFVLSSSLQLSPNTSGLKTSNDSLYSTSVCPISPVMQSIIANGGIKFKSSWNPTLYASIGVVYFLAQIESSLWKVWKELNGITFFIPKDFAIRDKLLPTFLLVAAAGSIKFPFSSKQLIISASPYPDNASRYVCWYVLTIFLTNIVHPRVPASFKLTNKCLLISINNTASWITVVIQNILILSDNLNHFLSGITSTSKPCSLRPSFILPPTWSGRRIFFPMKRLRLLGLRWSGWPWENQIYWAEKISFFISSGILWDMFQLPKYASSSSPIHGSVAKIHFLS